MEPRPISILDSLHSSRQNLLHAALPPFSSPSLPHLTHPPHKMTQFATTTVTIGPHSFRDTRFYLVEWTTNPSHSTTATAPVPSPPRRSASPPKSSTAPAASQAITPSLIQRLNAASLTDPALATLLRRAATGQATPEELGGLSKKIEQLRKEEEQEQNPPPAPAKETEPTPPIPDEVTPPVPHPALVIEFAESRHSRFLVPDHFLCVTLTPRAAPSVPITTVALLLSFFVFPPDRSVRGREHEYLASEGGIPPPPPVPIDVIVEGVREGERDKFMRASRLGRPRDTGLENWWKNTIGSVPSRVHVVHQTRPKVDELPQPPSMSRTNSEITTVPMKRGASGTPMSGGGGGPNKRGKSTVTAAPIPPPSSTSRRRAAPRGSTTRSRSSTTGLPIDYRDSPEPPDLDPSHPDSDLLPPPSSTRRQSRTTTSAAVGSPAPSAVGQAPPPARKKPGPKPGWKKARAAAGGAVGGGGGGGAKAKRKKKEASSDEDDWSGIKVIE
ncbi:hypothetical protein JCM16303_004283 [Sporobolomyces ruberrimus]